MSSVWIRDDILKDLETGGWLTIREPAHISYHHGAREYVTRERLDKALAFKEYVHQRLDEAHVPHNPEPDSNAKHGCRIEGRLNFLLARVEKAEAAGYEKRTSEEGPHIAKRLAQYRDRTAKAEAALCVAKEALEKIQCYTLAGVVRVEAGQPNRLDATVLDNITRDTLPVIRAALTVANEKEC